MTKNLEALEDVMRFIYDKISYAEINSVVSHCNNCGGDNTLDFKHNTDGTIEVVCRECGQKDENNMLSYAVRTCGLE